MPLLDDIGIFKPKTIKPSSAKFQLQDDIGVLAPTKPTTTPRFTGRRFGGAGETFLRPAPKPTLWQKVKRLFEAPPSERIAKSQVSYAISKMTGAPQLEVERNLPAYTKQLGLRTTPTSEELVSTAVMFPVMAGMAAHPLGTLAGIGGFMALDEIENFIVSKVQKEPYRFRASRGLKSFLPQATAQEWKDFVDLADFVGKGALLGGIYKKAPKIKQALLHTSIEKYNLPRRVYVSPGKIRTLLEVSPGEKISPAEADLVKGLGLTSKQYRMATQRGVAIEVPAEKVVNIVDKPFWGKVKNTFGLKPIVETRIFRGKARVAPTAFLPERITAPAPKVAPKFIGKKAEIAPAPMKPTPIPKPTPKVPPKPAEVAKEPIVKPEAKPVKVPENLYEQYQKQTPNSDTDVIKIGNIKVKKLTEIPDFVEIKKLPSGKKANAYVTDLKTIFIKKGLSEKEFNEAIKHELGHIAEGKTVEFKKEYPELAKPPKAPEKPPKVEKPTKPYIGIKLGTDKWMEVWKEHPELQEEMLAYQKTLKKPSDIQARIEELEAVKEELSPTQLKELSQLKKAAKAPEITPPEPIKETPQDVFKFFEEKAEQIQETDVEKAMQPLTPTEKEVQREEFDAVLKEMEQDPSSNLFLAVKQLGGIKSYTGGFEKEELSFIPLYLRNNKTGSYPDELATELSQFGWQFEDEKAFLDTLSDLVRKKAFITGAPAVAGKVVRTPSAITKAVKVAMKKSKPKPAFKLVGKPYEGELVTSAQKVVAHILARQKGLTPRQFQYLKQVFTGKKTMATKTPTGRIKKEPMTKQETEELIRALKSVVPQEIGEGARITRKKSLVPASFFTKLPPEAVKIGIRPGPAEGKPAGVMSRFTPTARYMKKVGAYEEIYKPMKQALWRRMNEARELRALEREVFKGIKDDSPKDIAMFEYKERKLSAKSAKALTEQDKKNVDLLEIRFRDFLDRINGKRVRLGKKPIKPRKDYAPHIFDAVTEATMKEKYPLSNETLGALQDFVISTKTTGRFLQRRTGAENYRKSLHAAWRAYKNMALDIIYYSEPLYRAKSYIKYYPPTTQRYLKSFLKNGFFNKASEIETEIRESTKWLDRISEKAPTISKPKNVSHSILQSGRGLMHIGGIGLNYTTVIKNATQSVLTYNLVDTADTAKAMELLTADIKKFIRVAATNPMFLGRFPFEIREVDLMRILRGTMIPYRMVDMFNVAFAYNAGLIHELRPVAKAKGMDIDSLLDEYLSRYKGNIDQVLSDMETGVDFGKQIDDAITLTGEMSQWSYYKPDMPRIFWEEPTATLAIFQSWPLYKTLHHYPELFNRMFTGKDFKGRPVSKEQRMGLFKDLILMALIATGLSKLGIDIWRTVGPGVITIPFVNSPYVKLAQGLSDVISGAFIADEKARKWVISRGLRQMEDTMWLFVPAGVAIRREIKKAEKKEEKTVSRFTGKAFRPSLRPTYRRPRFTGRRVKR